MRHTAWTMIAAPLMAAAVVALPRPGNATAQENQGQSTDGRLTRVKPAESFDAGAWKKRLTSDDLAERQKAFDELATLARRDDAAREAIEAWSREESTSGLGWTSRLLLRELDRRPRRAARAGPGPGRSVFGEDFDFDDLTNRFEDLDAMLGDLRARMDGMMRELPESGDGDASTSKSSSMSLEIQPDGVTCKIVEDVDGKEETKEYTAKSLDELLQAHPELRGRLQVGTFPRSFSFSVPDHRLFSTDGRDFMRVAPGPRAYVLGDPDLVRPSFEGPRTDRLGIYCGPVGDEDGKALGLEPGVGLRVQSTVPGSMASILGLRPGDVVVEMNRKPIRSSDDVKAVLKDRAEDAEVSVVVVGSEGRRTLTWKPAAPKADAHEGAKDSRSL